jgi:outer membrane lipoprotein SlyB
MQKITLTAVAIALALAGCATHNTGANYRPVIDKKGIDQTQLDTDLQECQRYATEVANAAEQAATGAVAGALFGAVLAAAAGGGYSRSQHAAVGGVTGAAAGAVSGERDQRNIIRRCMSGRGYNVLQ